MPPPPTKLDKSRRAAPVNANYFISFAVNCLPAVREWAQSRGLPSSKGAQKGMVSARPENPRPLPKGPESRSPFPLKLPKRRGEGNRLHRLVSLRSSLAAMRTECRLFLLAATAAPARLLGDPP